MKKFSLVLLPLLLTLGTVGCGRKVVVTNVPEGVNVAAVQNWLAADGLFKELGTRTDELTNATIGLHSEFPDETTYQKTLEGFGRVDQIGIEAGEFLNSVPQTWNADVSSKVQGYVNAIADALKSSIDDGLAHIKDGPKKDALKVLVDLVNSAVKTGLALTAQPISLHIEQFPFRLREATVDMHCPVRMVRSS